MTTTVPIACTLNGGDYAERVAWIREFNREELLSHRVDGRTLSLRYRSRAITKVRELVRREEECCAFLQFSLREGADGVDLEIRAPEESAESAPQLLAPFLVGTVDEVSVGSCGDANCGCHVRNANVSSRPMVASVAKSGAAIAIACGVCCLLPFALPAVAATTAGAFVAAFGSTYWWAVKIAVGLAVFGWGWVAWQSIRTGKAANPRTVRAMVVATFVLGLALTWPYVERPLIRLLQR